MLLDGNYHQDEDGDDDEVFALKGLEEEDDETEDEDEEMEDEDEEEFSERIPTHDMKARKSKKKAKGVQLSEEEESAEEEETWGRSKSAYYSSNAAQLESDDEESHELEEQEAKRLQAKTREDMAEGDFGLDDIPDIECVEDAEYVPTLVGHLDSLN